MPHRTAYYPAMTAGPLILEATLPDGGVQRAEIAGDLATLGRAEDCDVVLADETISRRHVRIQRRDGGWLIADAGSQHGIHVDGVRVPELFVHGEARFRLGLTEIVAWHGLPETQPTPLAARRPSGAPFQLAQQAALLLAAVAGLAAVVGAFLSWGVLATGAGELRSDGMDDGRAGMPVVVLGLFVAAVGLSGAWPARAWLRGLLVLVLGFALLAVAVVEGREIQNTTALAEAFGAEGRARLGPGLVLVFAGAAGAMACGFATVALRLIALGEELSGGEPMRRA